MRKFLLLTVLGFVFTYGTNAQMNFSSEIQNHLNQSLSQSQFSDANQTPETFGIQDNNDLERRRRGGGRNAFKEGSMVFQLGYGVPNLVGAVFNAYKTYDGFTVSSVGPLHAEFEYGLSDNIGLGLSINMAFSNVEYETGWVDTNDRDLMAGIKYSAMAFNARFNYHFINNRNFDMFFGAGIGYGSRNYDYWSEDDDFDFGSISSFIPLGFEFTLGMRYYFTDNIGLYAEIGAAKSIIQTGLAIKI